MREKGGTEGNILTYSIACRHVTHQSAARPFAHPFSLPPVTHPGNSKSKCQCQGIDHPAGRREKEEEKA